MKTSNLKSKLFLLLILSVFAATFFCSCDKETYTYYSVEGRIIDKITKEAVGNIMVSYHKYDISHYQNENNSRPNNAYKTSPPEYDQWSNLNGEFRMIAPFFNEYCPSQLYIYDVYGSLDFEDVIYRDTIISIDFSKAIFSGTPTKKYKGEYTLNIGDIEIEKKN